MPISKLKVIGEMMKQFEKKKIEYAIYLGILLIIGVVFFFFVGERGYILERDSGAFLDAGEKIPYQYIIYPKFLEICQNIFGKEYYLEWICNIQAIFALIVSLITTEYLRKSYKFNYVCGILIFFCTFGPYAYSLPQYVSSHSIMTEGLAFPLFYLWMLCALQIYLKKKNRWFLPLFSVTLIMAYTRTQLMLFFIVSFAIVVERVVTYIFHKIKACNIKKFIRICILIGVISLFLGVKIFLIFIHNNIYPQMTDAVAGRVFCAAEESDVELFEGRNRDLFLGIYDEIEQMKTRQIYFRSGIRQWEDIVNATNENTKMLGWIIRPYYPEIETEQLNDVKGQLAYTMIVEHWDDYLSMTANLLLQSLVVSIFIHPESAYVLGYTIAVLLYVSGIASIIWSKKRYNLENKYIFPLLITLLVIASLCVITNVIFMGLQRYVVYPFGFFYISLILIYVGVRKKKTK